MRNAARFVNMNLEGFVPGEPEPTTEADRWMFSRLARLVRSLDEAYDQFEFADVARELYAFFWNEFCDWYIELSKARLNAGGEERAVMQRNLVFVLDTALRLLHPAMPFVTEQIYQELPGEKEAPYLMVASWPDADELAKFIDDEAEQVITMVTQVVSGIRSIRARYGISPRAELEAVVKAQDEEASQLFKSQVELISTLANAKISSVSVEMARPEESSVCLANGVEVYVALSGLVDFDKERARLEKEIGKLEKDFTKFDKKLSNPGFLSKAAPEVIEKDRAKLADITDRLTRLRAELAEISQEG